MIERCIGSLKGMSPNRDDVRKSGRAIFLSLAGQSLVLTILLACLWSD
jgi:hypothetical protein